MDMSLEQKNILNEALNDNWDVLIIKGPAGSGKTTLLNEIFQNYKTNKPEYKIMPAAFTGRASSVLRTKGLLNAKTVNFWIWGRRTMYKAFERFYKLELMKEDRNEDDNELWIIDESSMLQENLLTNLFDYIHYPTRDPKLHIYKAKLEHLIEDEYFKVKSNKKIIFCGDENQLPPLFARKGYIKPALNNRMISKLNLIVKEFNLETLHRHKNSKDIHKLGFDLEDLNNNNIKELDFNDYSKTNVSFMEENSMKNIIESFHKIFKSSPYETKYITYNNQIAHEFNILFRSQLHDVNLKELLIEGELMNITANNYFHDLWNGDLIEVTSVGNVIEGPDLHVKASKQKDEKLLTVDKEISLNFTKIDFRNTENNVEYKDIFIVNETLNNDDEDNWIYIDREELYFQIEEYMHAFFLYRNPNYSNLEKNEQKKLRETDNYNNALYVNYAYAMTGHKSQGGEWNNVFLDLTTVKKDKEMNTYRISKTADQPKGWKYTAATRATNHITVIPKRDALVLT